MSFTPEQVAALRADLHTGHVKSRKQAGRMLDYIEGWHAEAEANRIFGHHAWDSETVDLRLVAEKPRKIGDAGVDGWSVSYLCKVRVTVITPEGLEVVREGVGAGHGIDRDLGLAHESAAKEAATDAEKRALKTFGNPFGLALYDKTRAHVSDAPPPPDPHAPKPRKSSAQAKRDGDDQKIKADIAAADTDGIRAWFENFDAWTAELPLSWLDSIRDQLELRREELMRPTLNAEAELDDAFRSTMAGGSDRSVSGHDHHMAAE